MKWFTKIFFIFFLLPFFSNAQQVIFCEQVDNFGNPKNASKEFSISEKGGFFKILVKLNKKVDAGKIIFDVYSMKESKEIFHNSLRMEVKPDLTWFFKEITFFKPGEYHVYVYDYRDQLLGVGQVLIKMR